MFTSVGANIRSMGTNRQKQSQLNAGRRAAMGKRKSILLSWSLSYLVILLIPILIGAAVFVEARKMLEEEVSRSNMVLLSQIQDSIDSQIADVSGIGSQLALDSQLNSFINHASEPDARWRLMATELIRSFKSIRVGNGLIREMYVYVKDADVTLSSSSLASKRLLYNILYQGTDVTEGQWSQLMDTTREGRFRNMQLLGDDGSVNDTLVYVQPFPLRASENSPATLVVTLDPDRFQQAVDHVRLEKESTVFIVDREGQTLFSSSPIVTPYIIRDSVEDDAVNPSKETRVEERGGESVTVSRISSGVQDWEYVSIVPTRIYAQKLMVIRNIMISGVIGGLVLGGLASWWFTRRNYRPLGRIMSIVSDQVRGKWEQPGDEFGVLHGVLTKALEEQDRFAARLQEQQALIRGGFLTRLLRGRVPHEDKVEAEMQRLGLVFQSDTFAVLLLQIESYDGLFNSREPADEERKMQVVHLILTNVIEELVGAIGPVHSAEMEGRIAFLVNLSMEETEGESAARKIVEASLDAQQLIRSRFLVNFSVGVSRIRRGLLNIAACRREAEEALEYRLILGIGQIIDPDRIRKPKEELYYPLDLERQLVNYIATGNYARSTEVMNEILMTNFAGEPLSVELARCLMFELIGTMLKAYEQVKLDDAEEEARRAELIRRLFACETFEEIEIELLEILENICQTVQERKRSHNEELKQQLLEFIEENYADVNLGLASISERFRFHPAYVSKYFKEQTGTNLIDYINQYRVNEAKAILKREDAAVQEVSERIGFLNSSSFIRVFKKYEGITPGQYKQNSRLSPPDIP
ncbi:hypothetical protein B9G55_06460 [Saccharibacillus sp. O16]|nr:hypothetical protein B9G55_06460 [Saccharibacillus sp. O16]